MTESLTVDGFRELFTSDREFAVIDPRASDDFAAGHLLAASNLPLTLIKAGISHLIPLTDTLCVICDAGGGEAERNRRYHGVAAGLRRHYETVARPSRDHYSQFQGEGGGLGGPGFPRHHAQAQ